MNPIFPDLVRRCAGGEPRRERERADAAEAAVPLEIISQLVDKRQHTHFKTADDALVRLAGRQMPPIKRISVDKALGSSAKHTVIRCYKVSSLEPVDA